MHTHLHVLLYPGNLINTLRLHVQIAQSDDGVHV